VKQKFVKMHGLGNDFIIMDFRQDEKEISAKTIQQLCDRNFGIGCDQFIIIKNSAKADCEMVIYNPDGSRAEACGNATRCVALILGKEKSTIQVGEKILETSYKNPEQITVNMGKPNFEWNKIPLSHEVDPMDIWKDGVKGHAVSMGNPHLIIFVNDAEKYNVKEIGPKFENDKLFPNRTNVDFAQVVDNQNIKLRVWERGTGETIACGSGACATFSVANKMGMVGKSANIQLKGGILKIECANDNSILMTGSASKVFEGEVTI
jgi:diaminopimelate epimerase